ncbi:hypothetical protein [Salimicrobium halophilum]|uniref:YqzE-like protein n=1 Tax=Salimicrobium halophilum TaxID=86666 RepID=A0A1G8PTD0_9BACI|nr:hypothetical protein [Salimicrobium halophilum]SDI95747.1 hypothetical protein SAMN04490247_0188 [Salimicrobium halophilum]
MKTMDYIRYLTENSLKYLEQPEKRQKKRRLRSFRFWFGDLWVISRYFFRK